MNRRTRAALPSAVPAALPADLPRYVLWRVLWWGRRRPAVGERPILPVSPVLLVARHPVERRDGGGERQLAGEDDGGDDLGELLDRAPADTAEDLQALALSGKAGAAAVGGDDERGDGDRDIEVACLRHLGIDDAGRRLGDV